jgi:SAM-dependent methyltransferase
MTGDLERPIAAGWLALREPADTRARDAVAGEILPLLLDRLTAGPPDPSRAGLRIVDLGAGTGANLRWLAPRLPDPDAQHWLLVDHDPGLLARGPVQATAVRADVTDLTRVLAEHGGADLVTAAALLDLLDPKQLAAIVDAVVQAEVPALFSLSVTGDVRVDPADPADEPLAAAFDAHQRRDGRLGPDAGDLAAQLFRERGWQVLQVRTPWLLDSAREPDLVAAWLDGRVEAAVEDRPELAAEAADWLNRRTGLAPGALTAVVGHVDVLAVPG